MKIFEKYVFEDFLKFFFLAFLVCQHALSTYVDSRKIMDIVFFRVFSFIDILKLANTLKNAIQFFFTFNLDSAGKEVRLTKINICEKRTNHLKFSLTRRTLY